MTIPNNSGCSATRPWVAPGTMDNCASGIEEAMRMLWSGRMESLSPEMMSAGAVMRLRSPEAERGKGKNDHIGVLGPD